MWTFLWRDGRWRANGCIPLAAGQDRPHLLTDTYKLVREAGAEVKESRNTRLAGRFTSMFYVHGNAAKVKDTLAQLKAETLHVVGAGRRCMQPRLRLRLCWVVVEMRFPQVVCTTVLETSIHESMKKNRWFLQALAGFIQLTEMMSLLADWDELAS